MVLLLLSCTIFFFISFLMSLIEMRHCMCLPEVGSPADVMDEISGWSKQSVGQFSG